MDKIKTGSAYEIAEVLRDLSRLRGSKDLSFGEKRMLDTARGLLVKEISLALKSPEASIEAQIASIFAAAAA
jgi:CarD family transcriptional regulator